MYTSFPHERVDVGIDTGPGLCLAYQRRSYLAYPGIPLHSAQDVHTYSRHHVFLFNHGQVSRLESIAQSSVFGWSNDIG